MATYQSYGDAISSQLQDIMARRQVEARQKMLDSLNVANMQSEAADRTENRRIQAEREKREAQDFQDRQATLADERKAKADSIREATGLKKVAGLTRGPVEDPDALKAVQEFASNRLTPAKPAETFLPSTQSVGASTLPGNPAQGGQGPTQTSPFTSTPSIPAPAKPAFYQGTDKEIDKADQKASLEDILKEIANTPGGKLSPVQGIRAEGALGRSLPAGVIQPQMQDAQMWDPNTNRLVPLPGAKVPFGTPPQMGSRAPREPRAPQGQVYEVSDGKGGTSLKYVVDGKATDLQGVDPGSHLAKPGAVGSGVKAPPFKLITPESGYKDTLNAVKTNPKSPQALQALHFQAGKVLNNPTAIPHAANAAKEIFDNQLEAIQRGDLTWFQPFNVIVQGVSDADTDEPLEPGSPEYQQLRELWTAATGNLQ